MCLIAKPRNQETVIKVWGHHGEKERGGQPPRGWDRGRGRSFHGNILLSTAKEKNTLQCKDGCNRKLLVSDRRKGEGPKLAGPSVTYFP